MSTSRSRLAQLVQSPVPVFGIEGRYAHALYSAASKSKKLDAVEKDMQKLEGFMASDAKFAAFVADPSLKKQQKKGKKDLTLHHPRGCYRVKNVAMNY